jgi:signal peptidase I
MTALWVLGGAALAAGFLAWLRSRYLMVAVVGGSMEPTLRPGDRVLARRVRRAPRRGSIVVLRTAAVAPADGPSSDLPDLLVKRVVAVAHDPVPDGPGAIPPGRLYVRGDAARSYDSREWGPIPVDAVAAHVIRVIAARDHSRHERSTEE